MFDEQKIRYYARKIILEAEQTRRPGRGGYKKQIQAAGALAQSNPGRLMKNLGVTNVAGKTDIEKLNSLLDQATSGADAMSQAYGKPLPRKDTTTGLEGIRVPVKVITPRDARKYLEHTLVGAQLSGMAKFIEDIQVEILGNDILLYLSPRPYSWGKQKTQKKQPKPKPEKTDPAVDEADTKRGVLGEPDLNPDRDEQDEASVAAMVSGPITPLGTGPTYPDRPKKKPKSPAEITGRAFGGAKPAKTKKKK